MTSPNHIMEDVEGHHLDPLLMMKAKVRNLHQDHLHQDHLTRATTTRATPTMITSIEATSTKTTATRTTCASITSTTGNPRRALRARPGRGCGAPVSGGAFPLSPASFLSLSLSPFPSPPRVFKLG